MNDYTILDQILDSTDFTTGGGSASAIAGAMAAALVALVARLSINKAYGLPDERYQEIIQAADKIAPELFLGAEADAQAYMLIKKAYALPKDTEEEKAIRKSAIQDAGIKAASVPMENAKKCKIIYSFCLALKGMSNPNTSSDLEGAVLLSRAGVIGCVLNIEANLFLIKDETIKAAFEKEAQELKQL